MGSRVQAGNAWAKACKDEIVKILFWGLSQPSFAKDRELSSELEPDDLLSDVDCCSH